MGRGSRSTRTVLFTRVTGLTERNMGLESLNSRMGLSTKDISRMETFTAKESTGIWMAELILETMSRTKSTGRESIS